MNTVTVRASKIYDVKIAGGLLHTLAEEIQRLGKVEKCAVISDSNVWPIYGETVCSALKDADFEVCHFQFPAGEEQKNAGVYLQILNFLAENALSRTDILIALGGGVVGDITGFAAATYLRGIRYVQLPTTLLAMVDSSVGGKTAIDLPAGKNLCGAFCQPSLVLCDTDTLHTLGREVFLDGCAEVIKYAVLYDSALFDHLEEKGAEFDRQAVITRCVQLKRDVVAADEYDSGARMKLNLGHTIAHAIEINSDYTVSHGKAVATGMAIIARSCGCIDALRIENCLKRFSLPTCTSFCAQKLCSAALSDKKRSGKMLTLVLPRRIGECDCENIEVAQLENFIKKGL